MNKRAIYTNGPPRPYCLLIAALICGWTLQARAMDYQIHGFAAQGFNWSDGNNYFGNSRRGSFDYFETGVNGTVVLAPHLLASGQLLLREAGRTDDAALRVDYAQLDYKFLDRSAINAGIRLGRVKNPFGLFNETRDVVFTRPGITLPQSIYYDGQGFRSLFFSSDGAQLYGGVTHGNHNTTLIVSHGFDFNLSDKEMNQLEGGNAIPGKVRVSRFFISRLQDETSDGIWRFAASHLHGSVMLKPDPGVPISEQLTADFFVLSGRYNAERWSLTSEYQMTQTHGNSSLTGNFSNKSDGIYVQADYRINPQWTLMSRYDGAFQNRNDRSGRDYAMQTGGDRYSQFAHDITVGGNWRPNDHWGVWAEYHHIDGTSTVPRLDNEGRTLADHWSMVMLMLGYRF